MCVHPLAGVKATAISAGNMHTCALRSDGKVVCWGNNANGQLGIGNQLNVGSLPGQMGDSMATVDLGTGMKCCQGEVRSFVGFFEHLVQ